GAAIPVARITITVGGTRAASAAGATGRSAPAWLPVTRRALWPVLQNPSPAVPAVDDASSSPAPGHTIWYDAPTPFVVARMVRVRLGTDPWTPICTAPTGGTAGHWSPAAR